MKHFEPEVDGVSVVALGSFNPAIFHPRWFSANSLIRTEEADEASIEIVSPPFSAFEAGLFRAQVIPERMSLETFDPSGILPLKDLCVGTFTILEHTPISAFGLNSNQHFSMTSADEWHRIGHYFTPKDSWNKVLDDPGMQGIAVRGKKTSFGAERVTIRMEPSVRCENGVYININLHYQLRDSEKFIEGGSTRDFLYALSNDWDGFLEYRKIVAGTLLTEALAE